VRLRLAPTSLFTHAPSLFRAAAGPARHYRLPAPRLRAAVDAGCRIARAGAIVMANHIGIGTSLPKANAAQHNASAAAAGVVSA
jgi:hypothetical protein